MRHICTFANRVVLWLGQSYEEFLAFFRTVIQNGDFVQATGIDNEATYTMLIEILDKSYWQPL